MALELNGTTGVSLVQDGVVTAADLASGAITSAALPTGSVIQVVSDTTTTAISGSTSTSYIDTGLSASITPLSASSKIIILVDINTTVYKLGTGYFLSGFNLVRDSSQINARLHGLYLNVGSDNNYYSNYSFSFIDSPSTKSSITYKVQMKNLVSGSIVALEGSDPSTLILMEIAG